jgi:HPt (histidine-containing phosphotransfer) domain-containing protein
MWNVNQVEVQDKPQRQTHWRDTKYPSRKILLIGMLLIILGGSILSGIGSWVYTAAYRGDLPLAKVGAQHLQKAEMFLAELRQNPFDAEHVALAQQEFGAALQSFTRVNRDLQFIPGISAFLPIYGNRIHAALHFVPLAIAISQAGISGCNLLNLLIARLHNPFNAQASGITMADLSFIAQSLHTIQTALTTVSNEANQIQPSDLQFAPGMSKYMNILHTDLPMLQTWIADIEQLLPAAQQLLGIDTPVNYLIEILDSTELRPGGGFIGNYGIATLSNGLLTDTHITDTDLLDHPFSEAGGGIPFPPQYRWFDIALGNWGLRDSNLDADFPTDARTAEALYTKEGGNLPVQGVLAITPTFIERTLAITGPIVVPEYHQTVNMQNLIQTIHYYQLGPGAEGPDTIASPDGYSSLRKRFTALLAEHLFDRIRQLAPSHAAAFLQLILNSLAPKDLQLYFNDARAEALLHNAHLDASIQTSPGDDLLIVDANIAASKTNSYITSTLTDQVSVDTAGNAIHHTTLLYAWTTTGNYVAPLYRDYVRVYVPPTSVLQSQNGWQPHGSSDAFGHEVWAGFFTLTYGHTNTITLVWKSPHAATHDAHGWHYQEMIQKQAGTTRTLHMQIVLPPSARAQNMPADAKMANDASKVINQLLTQNTNITVNYTV